MKYTDRFIEIPNRTFEFDGDAMNPEVRDTIAKIDPKDISSYTTYQEEPTSGTYLLMKNGEEFWIPMPLDQFEQSLNEQYARWAKG